MSRDEWSRSYQESGVLQISSSNLKSNQSHRNTDQDRVSIKHDTEIIFNQPDIHLLNKTMNSECLAIQVVQ